MIQVENIFFESQLVTQLSPGCVAHAHVVTCIVCRYFNWFKNTGKQGYQCGTTYKYIYIYTYYWQSQEVCILLDEHSSILGHNLRRIYRTQYMCIIFPRRSGIGPFQDELEIWTETCRSVIGEYMSSVLHRHRGFVSP